VHLRQDLIWFGEMLEAVKAEDNVRWLAITRRIHQTAAVCDTRSRDTLACLPKPPFIDFDAICHTRTRAGDLDYLAPGAATIIDRNAVFNI
jgi:hypothetical protein